MAPTPSTDEKAVEKTEASTSTPKKKPLHSFFKPRTTPKKNASVLSPTGVTALKNQALPEDVRERIARNKAQARAKLLARAAEAATKSGSTELAAGLEPSWKKALSRTLTQSYTTALAKFIADERTKCTIFPAPSAVFSAFNHSSFLRTKVVIIGQDPYHGPNQAHGMCFSVQDGVSFPPSLRNIFQELASDIPGFNVPKSGCLEKWANQGVLLLNTVLTVRAHTANSHQNKGWEKFTDAVVAAINARAGSPCVFLLWGGSARKKCAKVNAKRHCILTCAHPSPLSAHRGWFGSKHFSKCNEFLVKTGQSPIDWTL